MIFLFDLPTAGVLAPRQLAAELRSLVPGLTPDDISINRDKVEIRAPDGVDLAAIAAIIAAHVINPDYFPDEQDRRGATALAKARIDALAGTRAQDLAAAQVRDLVLALAVKLGAIGRNGAIKPWDRWGD